MNNPQSIPMDILIARVLREHVRHGRQDQDMEQLILASDYADDLIDRVRIGMSLETVESATCPGQAIAD